MCAEHPEEVSGSVDVEPVIRSGISRFSDEVGHLWCRLADYYIRLGQFEKARDVFEEGINSVVTVRDFSIIFDAYTACEESVLTAKMRLMEQDGGEDYTDEDAEQDANDVEMRLARLEYITEKRPLLLSSVILRQNPHNVHEWHKRANLFKEDETAKLKCYFEAIEAVNPVKAVGKLSTLHLSLARVYEENDDFESARQIYEKATQVQFKSVAELASIWCNWAEAELRKQEFEKARQVAQRAVTEPKSSVARRKAKARAEGKNQDADADTPVQDRVYRSVKLWSLYLDLEESLGTFETTRAAYDRVMELKVITPQMVLNYTAFLEEKEYFEDSFKVYEKGVALFEFPHVKPIWLQYLSKFEERYQGTKLERLRDMYEQVIKVVPTKDAAEFYLRYAKIEEKFGLARHAMNVYDRATKAVSTEEVMDMYLLYAAKV
jgi:pre-mRNA-splicing factor SYF1